MWANGICIGHVRRSGRVRERAGRGTGPVGQPPGDAVAAYRYDDLRDAKGDGAAGIGELALGGGEGRDDHVGAGAEEVIDYTHTYEHTCIPTYPLCLHINIYPLLRTLPP